jgi:hypothetical protein
MIGQLATNGLLSLTGPAPARVLTMEGGVNNRLPHLLPSCFLDQHDTPADTLL